MRRSFWNTLWSPIGFIALLGAIAASFRPFAFTFAASAGCGLGIALLAVAAERLLRGVSLSTLVSAAIGLFLGAALGLLVTAPLPSTPPTLLFFRIAITLCGAYVGAFAGWTQARSLGAHFFGPTPPRRSEVHEKILDTSVLIDGRIPDVLQAGFIEGRLIVPQFVLHELQAVADSQDSARRNRGRRGLDIAQRLRDTTGIEVDSQDFPAVREVDLKLIELAKLRRAAIVTNDFNLNKLAQVQSVRVLNINELANALKPVVLPGEAMRVFILKEGKEHNQGVAYLDDGTMVVVDNARRHISKTVDITVTSVLQTPAGKMIFGKFDERVQGGDTRPGPGSFSATSGVS